MLVILFLALWTSPVMACDPLPGALVVHHGGDGEGLWLPHPCEVEVGGSDIIVDGISVTAFMEGVVEARLASRGAWRKTEDGRAVAAIEAIREKAFAAMGAALDAGGHAEEVQAALEDVPGVTEVRVKDHHAVFRVVVAPDQTMRYQLRLHYPDEPRDTLRSAGLRPAMLVSNDPPLPPDAEEIVGALRDGRVVALLGTGLPPRIEVELWCEQLSSAALAVPRDPEEQQRTIAVSILETTRMTHAGCLSSLAMGEGERIVNAITGAQR
jgi:hypothetical protein